MRKIKLFLKKSLLKQLFVISAILLSITGLRAQAVGDYGSAASGNWTAFATTWVVCVTPGTWVGATAATAIPATTTNVWIHSGHIIKFDTSSKNCNNLTIENGGQLWANAANTSPVYMNVYGSTIKNDGVFGGTTDALSLKPYNSSSLTLTGSGSYGIARIQPQSASSSLIFDANATVTYAGSDGAGSSAIYNNGKDNITITINAGKTLTTGDYAYITVGTSGSAVPSTGYNITMNVYGVLTTGKGGHINLLNASTKTSTLHIYSGGTVNCNANLLMPAATSTGVLAIDNGGTLNFPQLTPAVTFNLGAVTTTTIDGTFDCGLSTTRTIAGTTTVSSTGKLRLQDTSFPSGVTLASGSTVEYYGTSAITMPATPATYQNLIVSNTTGVTQGAATTVTGTTTVNLGSILKTGAFTFTNSGTANINGSFQLDEGGWATGNDFVYGAASTLIFNNTSSSYGVASNDAYWPYTGGPNNVTVGTGGITLNAWRTVNGLIQTAAGVTIPSGQKLTVNGQLQINSGGYIGGISPEYGPASTLVYNVGAGGYNSNLEWPSTLAPFNVQVLNATPVTLSASRSIAGTLTLTSGKLSLGANNLTAAAISGASATNYVVTDGAGALIQPVAAAATVVFPIGASTSSFDPVSVTPVSAANFAAKVSGALSGTAASGYNYNTREWLLTPDAPSSTVVALTPSAVTVLGANPVIGMYDGISSYVNTVVSLTGNTYSGTFSTFAPFVTGATDLGTAVTSTKMAGVTFDGQTIHNDAKVELSIFDATGRKIMSSNKDILMTGNAKGIYLVNSKTGTLKIVL